MNHALSRDDLFTNEVIPQVYKKLRCDVRSPLMKTLIWSVETLGHEFNSTGLFIHFNKTRVASETLTENMISYSYLSHLYITFCFYWISYQITNAVRMTAWTFRLLPNQELSVAKAAQKAACSMEIKSISISWQTDEQQIKDLLSNIISLKTKHIQVSFASWPFELA